MADRALLVGINAYPGQPLNGCVNDVDEMAAYLVNERGFAPGAITFLKDGQGDDRAHHRRAAGPMLASAEV